MRVITYKEGFTSESFLSRFPSFSPVPWIQGLYQCNGALRIHNLECVSSGEAIGMDASSYVAAVALDPQSNERVLDLCCGLFSCLLNDCISSWDKDDSYCG